MGLFPEKKTLEKIKIALIGNPNVGKTAIFNYLTKSSQKVANFPGITVKGKSGFFTAKNKKFIVTDLPGTYGFGTDSPEEKVAKKFLLDEDLNLIINVVDATKLERNLILTLQLTGFKKPMIIVLTFADKIEEEGIDINYEELSKIFGVPVIPISALHKHDLEHLKQFIIQYIQSPLIPETILKADEILDLSPKIKALYLYLKNISIPKKLKNLSLEWLTFLVATNDEVVLEHFDRETREQINSILQETDMHLENEEVPVSLLFINYLYEKVQEIIKKVYSNKEEVNTKTIMELIDEVLLDPIVGLLVFSAVIWLTFKLTFDVSQPFSTLIEIMINQVIAMIHHYLPQNVFTSFLSDGLISGIGFILTFLPQLAFLFFGITLLEQTGYLTRVVFVTDRFLNKLGITGKSLAPLLLGFGCNVSGVLATKTIPDEKERIITILVNPFMSCSARLPVYVLISSALFPQIASLVITGIYLGGIMLAAFMIWVYRKTLFRGEQSSLLIEMPELTLPPTSSIFYQIYLYLKDFTLHAGFGITIGVVIIWVLSITGPSGYLGPDALNNQALIQQSWVYKIGQLLETIFKPMGWETPLIVALILGFIAKEVVVGTLAVLYGHGNMAQLVPILSSVMSPVQGIAYMVFVLTYTPCIATVFAIKEELGIKWTIFSIINGLVTAWFLSFLIITIGGLLL